jgi:hypothetical protein
MAINQAKFEEKTSLTFLLLFLLFSVFLNRSNFTYCSNHFVSSCPSYDHWDQDPFGRMVEQGLNELLNDMDIYQGNDRIGKFMGNS